MSPGKEPRRRIIKKPPDFHPLPRAVEQTIAHGQTSELNIKIVKFQKLYQESKTPQCVYIRNAEIIYIKAFDCFFSAQECTQSYGDYKYS